MLIRGNTVTYIFAYVPIWYEIPGPQQFELPVTGCVGTCRPKASNCLGGGGAGRRSTNSNCWTQSLRWERLSGGGGGAMITNYEAPCDTVLDL